MPKTLKTRPSVRPGFSMMEMVTVVAVMGILAVSFTPNVLNALEVRALDTAGREILSALQLARWQAAVGKLNHRLRFVQARGRWWFVIEVENPIGTWTPRRDFRPREISTKFGVSLDLPANASVIFQPTGIVQGFESDRNQIALTSAKLRALGVDHRRVVRFFASGSVYFAKDAGG
jgi:prepilin-type N-terminal cleavage/methylation domain-containing protein